VAGHKSEGNKRSGVRKPIEKKKGLKDGSGPKTSPEAQIEDDSVLTVDDGDDNTASVDDESNGDHSPDAASDGAASKGIASKDGASKGAPSNSPVGKKGPKDKATPQSPTKKAEESYGWQSAISFNSMSITTMLRELLEGMNARFRREKSERSYSQLYAIVPFPRVAYVFRFIIEEPCELIIDVYDMNPAISGSMTFMEIPAIMDSNIHFARRLLRKLTEKLPRPPWKFTMAQRVQHGLLNMDILKAKKHWMTLGVAR